MDKCNSILDDARDIRVCLFHRGQDVNETVIRELLESYNSDCDMTKTDYILNMITNNNDIALVNPDSNSEQSPSPEDDFDNPEDSDNLEDSDNSEDSDNPEDYDNPEDFGNLEDSGNYEDSSNLEASSILPDNSGNLEKYAANPVDSDNNTERSDKQLKRLKRLFKELKSCIKVEYATHDHDDHDDHDNHDTDKMTESKCATQNHDNHDNCDTDKMTEFNVVNSSGKREIAETIDLSSDSYNDMYCQSTNDSDVIIENIMPTSSSSSLHNSLIISNDNQAECFKKNDNDVIYIKKVTNKRVRMSKSPQPGCSKDFDSANKFPELEEVQECIDCDGCNNCYTSSKKLHEEARKIRSLLPASYSYHSIFGRLVCNNFAENRIELTLWDLLPVERPKVQFKRKSSSTDNLLQMKLSNFYNISAKEDNILEKEEKARANSKVIVDVNSENGEPTSPINNKDGFANRDIKETAIMDVSTNNTRQQIVTSVKIHDAKLNELIEKTKHVQSMSLIKKRKFDILDSKEDNSCNNDNNQQGTSFEKEKLSESGTSSKDINLCNTHHSEKSTLPKEASDYCDYSAPTTSKTSLLREAKLLYNANNMDAVAGPSTSSPSFPSSIRISPPKMKYVPQIYSPHPNVLRNVLNIQRPPTSSMWPTGTGAVHSLPLAGNKEASNMNTALPHSSVNCFKWNKARLHNRLLESKPLFEPSVRVDHVQNSNMFPKPCVFGSLTDASSSADNTLHPSQFNATNNVSALNLSQKSNNNEKNDNLGQDGDGVNAVQVCNQGNVDQKHMLPHTSEKAAPSNDVEGEEKKILLNEKARKLYYKIIPMFPSVNTDFIKKLCQNTADNVQGDEATLLQSLADHLLEHGSEHPYVRKEDPLTLINPIITYDLNEQYADLLGIFPEADPEYLRQVAEKIYNDPEKFKYFVQSKLENPDYPTREQYLNKKKISEQVKQYTTNFHVKQFLDIFPDPFTHFEDKNRQCVFNAYAVDFLKYSFNKIRVNTMLSFYSRHGYNLSATAKALESLSPNMKSKRCGKIMPTENIPLLQEIAFLQHKTEIQSYLDKLKAEEKEEFNKLKATNGLLECQCCYDNECMPSKCSTCEDGHLFCNLCIARSTDVTLADGKTHVLCLLNCGREFPLSVLQQILPPTKFSILLCKRQEAEVMAAGVEGLVSCPFCHFASIPPPEDKVFKCFNPDCMKESCRLCKELNHVPLKCDEVKTDAARLYLEEKMTEALVRKCYQCGRTFFKEEGCNKMTCVCGALMCYICDKPVKGYDHFQGQGAMGSNLCPLWSDDRRLNAEAVIKVCQETMKHIKEKNPNIDLNVQSLLPKLPPKRKGPHEDIVNANALPIHADRIARQIQ